MSRTAVVILNWNGLPLLRRYLPDVVKNSRTEGVDVIVADNASSDGSLAMLRSEYPRVGIIALDHNYGFAAGYNKALAQLDHDYVVLLNSDVAPENGWLEPLIAIMDGMPDVAVCGPKLRDDKDRRLFEYAGAAGGFLDVMCYPFCRGRIMDSVETDNGQYDDDCDVLWVSGAALMIRRKLYLECGGLDEDFFAHMEEIDLCWRLRNKGYRIRLAGNAAVYHLGGATLSSGDPHKTFLNFRNNLTMLVKNHNSRWWWIVLLCRMTLDSAAFARFLLGQPSFAAAVVKAHLGFWGSLRSTLRKRKELKRGRSRRVADGIRPYLMIWKYYVRGERTWDKQEKG